MLHKLKSKAGMTLMEMMVSLLIMVLLVLAMGTGMNAGVRVYNDANFESNSASLAANINTALTDMLRYAQDVKTPTGEGAPDFVFTNLEYGLRDAYVECDENGILKIYFWAESAGGTTPTVPEPKALVNSGSYNKLTVKDDFTITPYEDTRGRYFLIDYTITSPDGKTRDTEAVVRLMAK